MTSRGSDESRRDGGPTGKLARSDQQPGRERERERWRQKSRGGVAPRQTSSLWNIGPTGRCFKTNPQHARLLSGANSPNGGVRSAFRRRTTTGRSSSPRRRARVPKRVGERGRSGWSWYLCSAKQTRQGRDAECGAEEGWSAGGRGPLAPSLAYLCRHG